MSASTTLLLNSPTAIAQRARSGHVGWQKPAAMLASRLVLFALFQAIFAVGFALAGDPHPWQASIAWWIYSASFANLVSIGLLAWLAKGEGLRLVDLYRAEKSSFWRELAIALGVIVIAGPLVMLPNIGLGALLFGDPNAAAALMFRPLPLWAIYFSAVLFPVSIALSEIPTYYSYVMPRLMALAPQRWFGVVLLVSACHAAQHVTLPLIFDGRFLLWRLLMFFPFAVFVALVLRWRPRLLPYMMVIHGLLDASLVFMLLSAL